jgi:hypothetical protein
MTDSTNPWRFLRRSMPLRKEIVGGVECVAIHRDDRQHADSPLAWVGCTLCPMWADPLTEKHLHGCKVPGGPLHGCTVGVEFYTWVPTHIVVARMLEGPPSDPTEGTS